ncbi:unnamed protein product [Discosporangium mesarthrocarpum]
MRDRCPENLKALAMKAVANMSQFLESQHPGPTVEVLLTSVRVLTRVLPAILSDPVLQEWCWERHR